MKSGNLNFLEISGSLQACNGTAFTYTCLLSAAVCIRLASCWRWPVRATFLLVAAIQTVFTFLTGCEARNLFLKIGYKVSGHPVYCICYYTLICSARNAHWICNCVYCIKQALLTTYNPETSLTPGEHASECVWGSFLHSLRYCYPGDFCSVGRIANIEFAAHWSLFLWPNITWCMFSFILSCTAYRTNYQAHWMYCVGK